MSSGSVSSLPELPLIIATWVDTVCFLESHASMRPVFSPCSNTLCDLYSNCFLAAETLSSWTSRRAAESRPICGSPLRSPHTGPPASGHRIQPGAEKPGKTCGPSQKHFGTAPDMCFKTFPASGGFVWRGVRRPKRHNEPVALPAFPSPSTWRVYRGS